MIESSVRRWSPRSGRSWVVVSGFAVVTCLASCSDDASNNASDRASDGTPSNGGGSSGSSGSTAGPGASSGNVPVPDPLKNPTDGPPAGNPNVEATCNVPTDAGLADASNPRTVVGAGTPESCTSKAFVDAVAKGGVITFACGPNPVTITLDETAKIFNNTGPEIVIDGGGLVTLSGGGKRRILYMNTCDEAQGWTTSHCDNQDHPRLTVQNITFVDGNSKGETEQDGGGAVWVNGGRFRIVNSRFFRNACIDTGPDVGGGAIRVFQQYEGLPVYVVNSTFGGKDGFGNTGSNGGGISSIGVSWTIINSLVSYNQAVGHESDGGGAGGGIYNDGNEMTLTICGTRIEYNQANAFGSAIFFVSNNHTGNVVIDRSNITNNTGGSWYPTYPQISNHDDTPIDVTNSTIQ